MKKLLFTFLGLVVFFLPLFASAYTISSSIANGNALNSCGNFGADEMSCAQQFTTVAGGNIQDALLVFSRDSGATANASYHIQGDAGGVPDGTDIAVSSDTFDASTLPSTVGFNACNTSGAGGTEQLHFSSGTLAAATPYWIVVEFDNATDLRVCGDTSYDGTAKQLNSGVWNNTPGSPFFFSVDISDGSSAPSGVWNFSTTTTLVDNPTEQMFDAVVLFLMSMAFVIWLLRK